MKERIHNRLNHALRYPIALWMLMSICCVSAQSEDPVMIDNLKYLIYPDTKTAMVAWQTDENIDTDVVIPFEVNYEGESYKVTEIVTAAFRDCTTLKSVIIQNSLVTIRTVAFQNCTSLSSITIPVSVTTIEGGIFYGCSALTSVICEAGNPPEVGGELGLRNYSSCTLYVPGGVCKAKYAADPAWGQFSDVQSLPYVYYYDTKTAAVTCCDETLGSDYIIPDTIEHNGETFTITEIMPEAFADCTELTSISIPNEIKRIESKTFAGCTSLESVDLGYGIYSIEDYAFDGCESITAIRCMAPYAPFVKAYTFPEVLFKQATLTVPEESLLDYTQTNPWSRFRNYLTVSGSLSLSHYQVEMAANKVFQLGVYGCDGDVTWSSSNPSVAYANECGLVVAMGITGSTDITATYGDESVSCRFIISSLQRTKAQRLYAPAINDYDEEIEPESISMKSVSGNPLMVNVRLEPVGASTTMDWTTSDSSVATVKNGLVTLHNQGWVTIGVATENGLGETVKVNNGVTTGTGFITEEASEGNDVYDLSGRRVLEAATPSQLKDLNRGVYIVNGKKLLVK